MPRILTAIALHLNTWKAIAGTVLQCITAQCPAYLFNSYTEPGLHTEARVSLMASRHAPETETQRQPKSHSLQW
jgi:hypothetical protein